MKRCEFEDRVVQALRTRMLEKEIDDHIASCAACRETARVSNWMHRFATSLPLPPLPDVAQIRLAAQLAERERARRRALLPIALFQRFLATLAIAAPAALLLWKWQQLFLFVEALSRGNVAWSLAHVPSLSLPFVSTFLAAAAVAVALSIQSVLAEE